MKQPQWFTVSGPSGSGKSSLLRRLREHFPLAQPLVRITTRKRKPGDDPDEYWYVSEERFHEFNKIGLLASAIKHHDFWHAAEAKDIVRACEPGVLRIADISVAALEQVHQFLWRERLEPNVRSVYLDLTSEVEIRRRITQRKTGETEAQIQLRIDECRLWGDYAHSSFLPLRIIDAMLPEERVFDEAIAHFTAPTA